jgi:arsenite methyltransferase
MYKQDIKEKVKERYGKIALLGNVDSCCIPGECCQVDDDNITKNDQNRSTSPIQSSKVIGYDASELELIPQSSILGVGCGAPTRFAHFKEGDAVVDLGSGAGIDVFLAAKKVGKSGRVIGIDMTDEMLEKARNNAKENGYVNVEFRKGDIETRIPIEDNSIDVVISNCVINLTTNKANTFKEVYRILKPDGIGRMIIYDLVTDKEIDKNSIDPDKWCSCIDGALTRENYLDSISRAGFSDVEVLEEKLYMNNENIDGRRITSLVIKAVKI